MLPRILLGLAALVLVVSLTALDDQQADGLDPADPEEFVVRVDRLIDRVHGGGPCRGCVMDLRAWQAEILPWFVEEGIVPASSTPRSEWSFHTDTRANHVLGQADCDGHVWMNARYVNPASPWFRDPEFLGTFVHELVHEQQGPACQENPRELVETTAVVVSLEVLAAMANGGNRHAALALLLELRGIVLSELRFRTLDDPAEARRYDRLAASMFDPWELAERDQRWRYWSARPAQRLFVFTAYAHDPYVLLVRALEHGKLDGLALERVVDWTRPYDSRVPTVRFDDLRAFLRRAELLFS